jgi:hypothetical protein
MISLLLAVCGQGYILPADVAEFNRKGSPQVNLPEALQIFPSNARSPEDKKLKHAGEADAADS